MKKKKIIASLLIIAIMISLMPVHILAVAQTIFTITPDKTDVHPGDTITYTVKMSAVQNLGGLKFKLSIPEGLTFIEGAATEGLQTKMSAAKAEYTASTKVFVVGSSNYSSNEETILMTFKCSVNEGVSGNKEVTFIIDNDDIVDTNGDNLSIDYSNPGSNVMITIPSTGISLNKSTLTLEEGKNETLIATLTPENSTDTIAWSSSDATKATVDQNGKVVAVKEGNVTITARTTSGKTATCNVTIIEPVCEHTSKTTVEATNATCTTDGNKEYKICDNCNKVFKADGVTATTIEAEKINALGHDFSIKKTNDTQHWNECSRCGSSDTKINHIGEGEYGKDETNHWKICGCGTKVDTAAHTPKTAVNENIHEATCTTAGSHDEVVYCSVCNYEMSRTEKTDAAKGHTNAEPVNENVVAATCTTKGTYDEVVYCSVCDAEVSRTAKTDAAKGHKAGSPVNENVVAATCTTKGTYDEVVYCSVCNSEMSRTAKETEMIPHDGSSSEWTSDETNHWKVCGCGIKVDTAAHTPKVAVNENIVAATCTKAGSHDEVVYCSVCNYEMSRTEKTDAAKGHTNAEPVNENVVAATCTKAGSHDEVVYCSVCNAEISRTAKTDAAKGHKAGNPVNENVVAAECEKDGSHDEVVYCSVCDHEMSRTAKTDVAKGHTEGTKVIENEIEATVDKEGSYEEVIYCTECKKELSREEKTTPKFKYEILEGADSSHITETSEGITIRANGKFEKFEDIKVDGQIVDKSNYTAKSGSTIVTLKPEYLNTLSVGEHKIAFIYDDGEIETKFKVADKQESGNIKDPGNITDNNKKPTSPITGDVSNMTLWIIGLVISGSLFVMVLGCKVKGTKRKSRH